MSNKTFEDALRKAWVKHKDAEIKMPDDEYIRVEESTWFRNIFTSGYEAASKPLDMLLFCPKCFEQHVDKADPTICQDCGDDVETHGKNRDVGVLCETFNPWLNPPHRSHRCEFCNHVWRPADSPTNGVLALKTTGEKDGTAKPVAFRNGKDFDDAVRAASKPPSWTPVSEGLPMVDMSNGDSSVTVIATIETRLLGLTTHVNAVTLWKMFDDKDGYFDVGQASKVIAWMPLPAPYCGGEIVTGEQDDK